MPAEAPVVAVFNLKGGVGKTTLASNVFRVMAEEMALEILLVDFDPQSNLSELLLTPDEFRALRDARRSILAILEPDPPDSIFKIAMNDLADIGDVSEYIETVWESSEDDGRVDLLAGDWGLITLSVRESASSMKIARQRLRDLFSKARNEYDLIVLDCNPSTSFMTRMAVEAADHLLIPVTLNRYAPIGLNLIKTYVDSLPTLPSRPKPMVLINEIQGSEATRAQNEAAIRASSYGKDTLVESVQASRVLEAKPDKTGFAVDLRLPYTAAVQANLAAVADEIAQKVGLA